MRALLKPAMAMVLAFAATTAVAAEKIAILDYCDPTDPGWAPTGGCLLKEGVAFAEFNALLTSVLSTAVAVIPPGASSLHSPKRTRARRSARSILADAPIRSPKWPSFGGGMVQPLKSG